MHRRLAWGGIATAIALATATVPARAQPGVRIVGTYWNPRAAPAVAMLQPPSLSYCIKHFHSRCYRPAQLDRAYDVGPLLRRGVNGRGVTIVIMDSFGSPTIRSDLRVFDRTFGLPDPPSLRIYQPVGKVPPFNSKNSNMVGWAAETTLDVEWAHAFAPGARIVLLETPVGQTSGIHGMQEMMDAARWALRHHIGDLISMSFGGGEPTFKHKATIRRLRSVFVDATRRGVGLVSATGDTGATQVENNGHDLFPFRATSWPATDPLVLAVGGTSVTLDVKGRRLSPDVVWHDRQGAGGGGLSTVFARPSYQASVRGIVGNHRGVPDISMSASDERGSLAYWSFTRRETWAVIAGTSLAAPEVAGLAADADQLAGHSIANLPAHVYAAAHGPRSGIVDITQGNNSFGPFKNGNGRTYTVRGFGARRGFDLASGLGTVDAALWVAALAGPS